ncbi:unnamed protein product [Allacma fusca]|uniref:J domain-containing protein n=1 Tax=Allacma fusca TaxID=39272 RepID=A0A8J2PDY1_9HEXA|nr:unnamed protein product [Allacma fusca]
MAHKMFREGRQLCLEGDIIRGLKMIQESVRIKPKEITFLANKAFWLQESKEYVKAVEVATKVLKMGSKNVMSHCVTFDSSLRLGDIEGCEMALRRMDRCRHKVTKRLCNIREKRIALARYLTARKNAQEHLEFQDAVKTIQECEKGLRLAPLDPDLLYCKLWALFEQQRYADLVDAYRSAHPKSRAKILETAPEIVAKCFYFLESIPEAIQVLESAPGRNLPSSKLLQNLKVLLQYQEVLETDTKFLDKIEAVHRTLEVWTELPKHAPLKKKLLITGINTALEFGKCSPALKFIEQLLLLQPHLSSNEDQAWRAKLSDLSELKRITSYRTANITPKRAFDIFQLPPQASWEEVQSQRKLLLKKYHPDKNEAGPGGTVWRSCYKSLTQELNNCFRYLQRNHDFQAQKKQLGKMKRKSETELSFQEEVDRLAREAKKMCQSEEKRRERMAKKDERKVRRKL